MAQSSTPQHFTPEESIIAKLGGRISGRVALTKIRGAEFTTEAVTRAEAYVFTGKLSPTQLKTLTQSFMNILAGEPLTKDSIRQWLALALHVADPHEGGLFPLLAHVENTANPNVTKIAYESLITVQAASSSRTKVMTSEDEEDPDQTPEEKERKKRVLPKIDADQGASGNSSDDIQYWSFVAAFMMRLAVRSRENILNAWPNMMNQYAKFFSGSAPQEEKPVPQSLDAMKAALEGNLRAKNTWVQAIATFETLTPQSNSAYGMISFLGIIPFSFSGMHAYSLFLEAIICSKMDENALLGYSACGPTMAALSTIREIMDKYEYKEDPRLNTNYTTYYKYARAISPEYFVNLQPKNCATLMYLMAKFISYYKTTSGPGPMSIVAITQLGERQKLAMDEAAKMIYDAAVSGEGAISSNIMKRANQQVQAQERERQVQEQTTGSLNARLRAAATSGVRPPPPPPL